MQIVRKAKGFVAKKFKHFKVATSEAIDVKKTDPLGAVKIEN